MRWRGTRFCSCPPGKTKRAEVFLRANRKDGKNRLLLKAPEEAQANRAADAEQRQGGRFGNYSGAIDDNIVHPVSPSGGNSVAIFGRCAVVSKTEVNRGCIVKGKDGAQIRGESVNGTAGCGIPNRIRRGIGQNGVIRTNLSKG